MAAYPPLVVPVLQPPLIMPTFKFGPDPVEVICGNCQKSVVTVTTAENSACAYFTACFLCCTEIFMLCFWIPLVMDSCKDVIHTCPSCGGKLGHYTP